jgi:hypothetical protein
MTTGAIFAGAAGCAYEGNTIVIVPRIIVTDDAAITDFEFIT